jgi:uncharacterized coiled-coil DUF342 family protein
MSGFFIRSLVASGDDVGTSEVAFQRGVNIIQGPSNSGKSVIVKCIEFMFGESAVPKIVLASGYDTLTMTLEDDNGGTLEISRKMRIEESEVNGEKIRQIKGDSSMDVVSHIEGIQSRRYSNDHTAKYAYNDLLLKLLGIDERFRIIGAKNRTGKWLTVKSFVHQFLLAKRRVVMEETFLINPGSGFSNETYNLNALTYLMEGKFEPPTEDDTPAQKEIKKRAVIDYIKSVRTVMEERQRELQDELANLGDENVEDRIDSILNEIPEIETRISGTNNEAREIAKSMMELSENLEESLLVKKRHERLKSLYEADIKRLKFILDGEDHLPSNNPETCPFCNAELKKEVKTSEYYEATKAELDKTRERLYALVDSESDVDEDISSIEKELSEFSESYDALTRKINESYAPKLNKLKAVLKSCERVVQLRQEIASRSEILGDIDNDLKDTTDIETSVDEFDAKSYMNPELFNHLSKTVAEAIKACNYPAFKSARLSKHTMDVVINGKPKDMDGEGYLAFLNSVYAFTLMEFMSANAAYPLNFLLLESPTLSLQGDDENAKEESIPREMKESLFKYFIKECGESQLIILENNVPENIDYSSTHYIKFVESWEEGRHGFLAHVHEFTDEEKADEMWQEGEEDE